MIINIDLFLNICIAVYQTWAKFFCMFLLFKTIQIKERPKKACPNTYRRKTILMQLLPVCQCNERKFEYTYYQISQRNYEISRSSINFGQLSSIYFAKLYITMKLSILKYNFLNCHLFILQNKPIYMGLNQGYRCPFCPKISGTKHNMQNHIRTHTGEKPYTCSFCSYAGTQKVCLNRHLATHHNETSK